MENVISSFVATALRVKGMFCRKRHVTLKKENIIFRCSCVQVSRSKNQIETEAQRLCGTELDNIKVNYQEGTYVVISANFAFPVNHITKVDALNKVLKASEVEVSYK